MIKNDGRVVNFLVFILILLISARQCAECGFTFCKHNNKALEKESVCAHLAFLPSISQRGG